VTEPTPDILGIVNASGFAFQLGIEHVVRDARETGWNVATRENPWRHSDSRTAGFADLVLQKGWATLVLECKRTRPEANWVFLVPSSEGGDSRSVTCAWTDWALRGGGLAGFAEVEFYPASPVSGFCVVRGHGENDSPMLERICGTLLDATEAIAHEQLQIDQHVDRERRRLRVYVPLVVTNATLSLCGFDPAAVSLSEGRIADAAWQSVPFIRFHKGLRTHLLDPPSRGNSLRDTLRARERSVFVVSAPHLVDFLRAWKALELWGNMPWDLQRATVAGTE
jgi:hypothetical protein